MKLGVGVFARADAFVEQRRVVCVVGVFGVGSKMQLKEFLRGK